jgi:hypothetical protein
MKRFALALSISALTPLASPTLALADGPKFVNAHVVGVTPNITIRGVNSAGSPWVVKNGKIKLDNDGHLEVRVKGLVIGEGALANGNPVAATLVGTTGTVTSVHAALTCGGPGSGVPFTITSTDSVALDPTGDFEFDAQLSIPEVCAQPIVLIRAATPATPGPWLAVSELSDD